MTTNKWLANYYKLNNSFQKKLVFRLGVDSGFFSEYNNMVLAMLYCLKHQIKFELYSGHTHFTLHDGWNDFFLPFGNPNTQLINKDYNLRPYIIEQSREAPLKKAVKYRFITAAYKTLFGIGYLTQDLWAQHRDPAFAQETFTVPALKMQNMPLLSATQQLIRALWQYNEQSALIVARLVSSAKLPTTDYVSIHVRAGDKFTEVKAAGFGQYMDLAARFSNNQTAFVMTDDYTVVEQLRLQYPAWKFYTLCEPTERGYFHRDFVRQDKAYKYHHHLRLFAELDIAAASAKFIGTYSSNVGMFVGMRKGEEQCACVDFERWLIW